MAEELIVLVDDANRPIGTAPKLASHHANTPLHRAFSCFVFDRKGRFLLTQRALSKKVFPGVWTNSCCGHPAAGETLEDAVRRRVGQELGASVTDLKLLLPRFRYRAEWDGVVENEMCPVFVATVSGPLEPDAAEVGEVSWEPWTEFRAAVLDGTREVSAWCRDQVAQLPEDPLHASAASRHDLPQAAREPDEGSLR